MGKTYFKTSLDRRLQDCITQNKEFTLVNPEECKLIMKGLKCLKVTKLKTL